MTDHQYDQEEFDQEEHSEGCPWCKIDELENRIDRLTMAIGKIITAAINYKDDPEGEKMAEAMNQAVELCHLFQRHADQPTH